MNGSPGSLARPSPAAPRLAYIGLGANIGSPRAALVRAIALLRSVGPLVALSSLWRTAPREVVEQPAFLNAVVAIGWGDGDPIALLQVLKRIERSLGRIDRERFGPREIDLDILLFSAMDAVVRLPELEVPHPRLRERRFALAPLAELAENEVDPVTGRTIGELLAQISGQAAERIEEGDWWTRASS